MEIIELITSDINNREKSLLLWAALFFIWALTVKGVRSTLPNLFKIFFGPKFFGIFLIFTLYILFSIYVLFEIGFWEKKLLKDSMIWFFGTATILFLNTNKAKDEDNFFKKIANDCFKFFVAIQFVVNMYVFSLPVELIAIPFTAFLGMIAGVAESDDEHKIIRKPIAVIINTIGLIYIIFSFSHAITDSNGFLTSLTFKKLSLPLILTFLLIPCLYSLAVMFLYETILMRLSFKTYYKKNLKRIKYNLFLTCNLNYNRLKKFNKIMFNFDLSTNEGLAIAMKEIKNKELAN